MKAFTKWWKKLKTANLKKIEILFKQIKKIEKNELRE